MRAVRYWSARNARWLNSLYEVLERVLLTLHPLFERLGLAVVDTVESGLRYSSSLVLLSSMVLLLGAAFFAAALRVVPTR